MAPDGKQSTAGATHHPTEEGEVGDRLDVLHPVGVVGDAHRPGEDGVSCLRVEGTDLGDGGPVYSGQFDDIVPVQGGEVVPVGLPTLGVGGDEGLVHRSGLDDVLGEPGEEGDVPSDMRLEIMVGDLGAEEEAAGIGGDFEADQPGLFEGVDHHHLASSAFETGEDGHETRMVGGRVGADQEEQVAPT